MTHDATSACSQVAWANGIRMHFVRQGAGPLLMLLHGWPQTSYMWRRVMPTLAQRWTVVAPDLRGYGLSDKPTWGYDKRTMAEDVRALARRLGGERVVLAGHDRGARIAHRYALDHPDEVERLILLDVIPTREVLRRMDCELAYGYWHWFFHALPDLPEALITNNLEAYLRWFFEHWAYRREVFDERTVAHYVSAFRRPGAVRAGLDDYRATLREDADADETSARAGARLAMPVLVLWGAQGLVGRLPVEAIWGPYAADLRAEAIPECGHFLAEERPDEVVERLHAFLG
jgi:haloacetate dehalogenase